MASNVLTDSRVGRRVVLRGTTEIEAELLEGTVGPAAATELVTFLPLVRHLPSIEILLNLYQAGQLISRAPVDGGGTDFRPCFAWLEQRGIAPQVMVFLTDPLRNISGPGTSVPSAVGKHRNPPGAVRPDHPRGQRKRRPLRAHREYRRPTRIGGPSLLEAGEMLSIAQEHSLLKLIRSPTRSSKRCRSRLTLTEKPPLNCWTSSSCLAKSMERR
jgi:hypothetical protein